MALFLYAPESKKMRIITINMRGVCLKAPENRIREHETPGIPALLLENIQDDSEIQQDEAGTKQKF